MPEFPKTTGFNFNIGATATDLGSLFAYGNVYKHPVTRHKADARGDGNWGVWRWNLDVATYPYFVDGFYLFRASNLIDANQVACCLGLKFNNKFFPFTDGIAFHNLGYDAYWANYNNTYIQMTGSWGTTNVNWESDLDCILLIPLPMYTSVS